MIHTAAFKEAIIYKNNMPNIEVLLHTSFVKEVRISFKKGQVMMEHHALYPIVVQVLDGAIDFGTQDKRQLLNEGSLVALSATVKHDLIALEDSIVRLSILIGTN